jgi:hypothetical protein
VRRKLTLAARVLAPKVGFLASPRIHTGGQFLPLATGSFKAFDLTALAAHLSPCDQRRLRRIDLPEQ